MLSQSPGIYILLGSILSAILSSVISGIILLTSNYFNNKSQLKREEKQHIWQIEREEQQRIWQEKSDKQKWNQEKIYDGYRKLLEVLIKLQQEEIETLNKTNDIIKWHQHHININKLILEFTIEFTMIIANHPDKNSEEFTKKVTIIDNSLKKDSSRVQDIIIEISEIMQHDSRIQSIN